MHACSRCHELQAGAPVVTGPLLRMMSAEDKTAGSDDIRVRELQELATQTTGRLYADGSLIPTDPKLSHAVEMLRAALDLVAPAPHTGTFTHARAHSL